MVVGLFRDGRAALLAAVVAAWPAVLVADPADPAQSPPGRFVTKGGVVLVKPGPTPEDFLVSLKRDTGRCSGDLSGRGKAYLSNIVTLSEPDPSSGTTCTIDLLYAPDFTAIDLKESAACLVWHGAGCSFAGTYRRRR